MNTGEASRTAMFNALFRAIESNRIPARRLFHDPFARMFLNPLDRLYVHLSRIPLFGKMVTIYIDFFWPGVRTAALGRTCWIDDQLRKALADGLRQVVILGAGYDARAYRFSQMHQVRVFEVDHPDTVSVKTGILFKARAVPRHVRYIGIDFNSQDLAALLKAGFDSREPTFIILEGVLHYLTAEAVEALFDSLRRLCAARSKIAFTYVHQGVIDGSAAFGHLRRVSQTLRHSGEKWNFGFDPEALPGFLESKGLRLLEDLGANEYRARYLGPGGGRLKGFEFYHVACAVFA